MQAWKSVEICAAYVDRNSRHVDAALVRPQSMLGSMIVALPAPLVLSEFCACFRVANSQNELETSVVTCLHPNVVYAAFVSC
jgi:hypothetical protein